MSVTCSRGSASPERRRGQPSAAVEYRLERLPAILRQRLAAREPPYTTEASANGWHFNTF